MTMIMCHVPAILSPHFSIEYRKHFTKVHVTVVGLFGATEELLIHISIYLFIAFSSSDEVLDLKIGEVLGHNVTGAGCICVFSLLVGLHYNLDNFVNGILGAQSKLYAL